MPRPTRKPTKTPPAKSARKPRAASAPVAPVVEFRPHVQFKPVVVPLPGNKFEVSAGKPIISQQEDVISTAEFARRVGTISQSYVQQLCAEGVILARRLSPRPSSKFLISLAELERYLNRTEGGGE